MDTVHYHEARKFEILKKPIPEIKDDEVLVHVRFCGICGSDEHIHSGELFADIFPLTPGHEISGEISKVGSAVTELAVGDKCVVSPIITCGNCFFCRRGNEVMCIKMVGYGVTRDGGLSEYVVVNEKNVHKFKNISFQDACLIEPTSCAVFGADRLQLPVGSSVLVLGAGPSGLILSQLLKVNGASTVVLAANKGVKTALAQEIGAADVYVELDRADPEAQWAKLKVDYPYGFDAVVEATGSEAIVNRSIDYVRRGGSLLLYGVYGPKAQVHWPPSKIFLDQITILSSFAQRYTFPRAVEYIESGKINVKGMVTDVFELKDYQAALDKVSSRDALKVVVKTSA
ncbi:GroES-like protein [Cylindrobasidium torrendii FP15055 ss-10]|uniref:GroES-like protein n=1 Tax=Cylindrobasidium torrendii FP15055 ss-10 TaxID=1314674 RepID=A0A0D7B3J6_9AGAR|nr:GroES-like protein [Cylindrobasidium torrendii FP15055 ss-10]